MKSLHDVGRLPSTGDWRAIHDPPQDRLGAELKSMFETLTAGPMPERLLQLADALEEAFQRGELFDHHASLDA